MSKKIVDIAIIREIINGKYMCFYKGNEYPMNIHARYEPIVQARSIVFKFLKSHNFTFDSIGGLFNKSGKDGILDHATVLNGVNKFKTHYHNPKMYYEFAEIYEQLWPMLQTSLVEVVTENPHALIHTKEDVINAIQKAFDFGAVFLEPEELYNELFVNTEKG